MKLYLNIEDNTLAIWTVSKNAMTVQNWEQPEAVKRTEVDKLNVCYIPLVTGECIDIQCGTNNKITLWVNDDYSIRPANNSKGFKIEAWNVTITQEHVIQPH